MPIFYQLLRHAITILDKRQYVLVFQRLVFLAILHQHYCLMHKVCNVTSVSSLLQTYMSALKTTVSWQGCAFKAMLFNQSAVWPRVWHCTVKCQCPCRLFNRSHSSRSTLTFSADVGHLSPWNCTEHRWTISSAKPGSCQCCACLALETIKSSC